MSDLLRHQTNNLRLDPSAVYDNLTPRESLEVWRHEQRLKLFRPLRDADIPDDGDRDYSMDLTR